MVLRNDWFIFLSRKFTYLYNKAVNYRYRAKPLDISINYSSRYMRPLILITTLLLCLNSCKEKKENCFSNFTFSKGNIKMSYSLKFNSSDTVYYQDEYINGNKKSLYYFIIKRNEKKILDSLVCKFKFPKDSLLLNSSINDGTTIAFSVDNKKLMLHETGPKEFWEFEKWIENIKPYKQLTPTKEKIEFADFSNMLPRPKIKK